MAKRPRFVAVRGAIRQRVIRKAFHPPIHPEPSNAVPRMDLRASSSTASLADRTATWNNHSGLSCGAGIAMPWWLSRIYAIRLRRLVT